MKVLITGANGFLGHYLTGQLLDNGFTVIATGQGECRLPFTSMNEFTYESMDFTDAAQVEKIFEKYKPIVVVHAGAMCKPDECELNKEQAYKTNVEGTRILLGTAGLYQTSFIYVSTDFVFDGEKGMYTEDDLPDPVNYYGKTKLEAEEAVKQYNGSWAIARTVLVYGKPLTGRSNILTVVKEKLEKGQGYKVVNDQVRTPTYVEDLAAGIILIIEKNATGTFHLSGKDILTPYEMACYVADLLQLDRSLLTKVTAADFSEIAQRPLKTGLTINKAVHELGFDPISFEEGLKKTFGL